MLAILAGCSTPASEALAPAVVARAERTRPVGDRNPPAEADLCGASELQWLVGRPRTEIPVPVQVVNRRVACTTCPISEDYSAYRLNIFYNEDTNLVESVRCG